MSKVSIVVISGSLEKLQLAAMMASVAAVSVQEVSVFLSMNALAPFAKAHPRTADPEGDVGRLMSTKNVPAFMDLFEQAVELGDAKVHRCSMAMEVLGFHKNDMKPFLADPMGLTKCMSVAEGGQCWSF